jgi:hypothetical protein
MRSDEDSSYTYVCEETTRQNKQFKFTTSKSFHSLMMDQFASMRDELIEQHNSEDIVGDIVYEISLNNKQENGYILGCRIDKAGVSNKYSEIYTAWDCRDY